MQGLELESHVSMGFSFAQWASPPYQNWGWVPRLWNRSPKGQIWAYSISSTFSPLLAMAPSPQKRAVLEQQEPKQTSTAPGLGTCWDGHGTPVRAPDHAWSLRECQPRSPASVHMCVGSRPAPSRPRDHSPQHEHLWKLHQTKGAGAGIRGGLGQALRQLWALGGFSWVPLPFSGSKHTSAYSSWVKPQFLTVLLWVPLVFKLR